MLKDKILTGIKNTLLLLSIVLLKKLLIIINHEDNGFCYGKNEQEIEEALQTLLSLERFY